MIRKRVPNSEFYLDGDLVLIAIGFAGPVRSGLLEQLPLALDSRGNVQTNSSYMTSMPGVFSAGDARRGQSLVVWAIAEGRKAAHNIDKFLMGESQLAACRIDVRPPIFWISLSEPGTISLNPLRCNYNQGTRIHCC